MNNDIHCGLAAIVEFDDSDPDRITGRFVRMASIPGLGIAHPAILYDSPSDLYWMVSNVNRDALRSWTYPNVSESTCGTPLLRVALQFALQLYPFSEIAICSLCIVHGMS